MNEFLAIIIMVVLFIIGAFFLFRGSTNTSSAPGIISLIVGAVLVIFGLYVAYLLIGAPSG